MAKKNLWKKTAALVLALGLTLGATGCEFLVADNVRDLEQVVATVDISDELAKEKKDVAAKVDELIADGALSTDIYKRDLISLFLSMGSSYIQYGYSYEDTFNLLMDSLTSRKILSQYAVSYFVKKGLTAEGVIDLETFKANELEKVTAKEKALLQAHPEVLTMKYYLTDFGSTDAESMEDYYQAVYSLQSSLNSSLDTAEANYIKETSHDHSHEDSRVTPTNANTKKADYVPMKADGTLDYDIYTGRNALDTCGEYEKVAGSTKSTRTKAYNQFLYNLQSYGLIEEGENASKITLLNYYYEELSSALSQALVNKYYEELKETVEEELTEERVKAEYQSLYNNQKAAFDNDYASFETAMGSVSDTSFLLYGLNNYGFVYNILLPFSQTQSQMYTAAKSKYQDEELYKFRENLLKDIKAEDLRDAWFCEEESEHYAYKVGEEYYFFEENKNTDKYEKLTHYAGNYPFQGTATENADGEWEFTYDADDKKDIDAFMEEFVEYVATTAGVDKTAAAANKNAAYGTYYELDDEGKPDYDKIDYKGFVYATGNFQLQNVNAKDYFNEETQAYKALSAVNELMFAYSTDTGCLNTYMGYAVNANKTNFVSEFEYAAQAVVKEGVGAYAVVPSDYGWHIIYCSYQFKADENSAGGVVYADGYNHAERETEGTFSYYFYEALKATTATTQSQSVQSKLIKEYEGAVTLYTDRYQDLLDIEA